MARVHSDGDAPLAERLLQLHTQLIAVISREFEPDEAAVEETFVNTDARATLKLGQARGVLMLAPAMLKHSGRRICAEHRQEVGGGGGPCREGPGQAHGEAAAAQGPACSTRGLDRRAGRRHLPCPLSRLAALAELLARS